MRIYILFIALFFGSYAGAYASSVCFKDQCIEVEVVSNPEDLKKGLQGRESIEKNKGMLFIFKTDGLHRFWMKEMKIPIDMLWLDAQGRIVTIAPSRQPCLSEPCDVYAPTDKARYVLEVANGFASDNQLKEGDALQLKDIN